MKKVFFIELSDKRYYWLADLLREEGYQIFDYGQENSFSDCHLIYIMALMEVVTKEKALKLKDKSILFCNKITEEAKKIVAEKNITLYNAIDNESYVIKNACLTAEGALGYIIFNTDTSLKNMPALIVGYGRVGKALAKVFDDNHMEVSIATNDKNEFALSSIYSKKVFAVNDLEAKVKGYKAIINTVPKLVIDSKVIKNVDKDCFILDLASNPGGVDFDYARERNLNVIHATSVPAAASPKAAALILKEAILERLKNL